MEATAQRIRGDTKDLSATRRAGVSRGERGVKGKAAASLLRYEIRESAKFYTIY